MMLCHALPSQCVGCDWWRIDNLIVDSTTVTDGLVESVSKRTTCLKKNPAVSELFENIIKTVPLYSYGTQMPIFIVS